MKILEALQAHSVRLCFGSRYLIFGGGKWVVMEMREGYLEAEVILRTSDEDAAVEVLLGEKKGRKDEIN